MVSQPQLNGCKGVILSKLNPKTGRCGVCLEDGTGINVKPGNLIKLSSAQILEIALKKLEKAGGIEEGDGEQGNDDATNYLKELVAVGTARFHLDEFPKAARIYYQAYRIAMQTQDDDLFPIAHKMLQAYAKCEEERLLKEAFRLGQKSLMISGCPRYIRQDVKNIEEVMRRTGIEIRDTTTDRRVKPGSSTALNPEQRLEDALDKLKKAGGTEEECEGEESATSPSEYLEELMAVGDARFALGQHDKAASIFYRAYYAAMHKRKTINDPGSFSIAHKMLQAYSKCEEEHQLKQGHGIRHGSANVDDARLSVLHLPR